MAEDIDELLNAKTNNKYDFKLRSATLIKEKNCCQVEVLYKDGAILLPEDKIIAGEVIKNSLPAGFDYDIKFVKNFVTNEAVKNKIKDFMSKSYSSINFQITALDCEGQEGKVIFTVDEEILPYVKDKCISLALEGFLKDQFDKNISVNFVAQSKENFVELPEEDLIFEEDFVQNTGSRYINLTDVTPLVGGLSDTQAFYIEDKKISGTEAVLCGKITYIKECSFMKKIKPKGSEDEGDEITEQRCYFRFGIEDYSGKLSCVIFPSANNIDKVKQLAAGDNVLVFGKLDEDKFGGVSMKVKDISLCVIEPEKEEVIDFKPEPENYRYVFPDPYVYYTQGNLFDMAAPDLPEFIKNNKFVVFDLETTGLEYSAGAKILEIGAIKLENGEMTEKFECFVNPEMKIPKDATAVHGIKDDDVKDAYNYSKVLRDFYKFTRGCYLVGYNVEFDYGFIKFYGKKCGYNFDNKRIDVLKMATKNVKGITRFKLGLVADALGVSLENAHRAINDTRATVDVFLKLAEFYQDGII